MLCLLFCTVFLCSTDLILDFEDRVGKCGIVWQGSIRTSQPSLNRTQSILFGSFRLLSLFTVSSGKRINRFSGISLMIKKWNERL